MLVCAQVDRKPLIDAGESGGPELGDVGAMQSSELGDGASTAAGLLGQDIDVKQDPSYTGLAQPTKPLVKKGQKLLFLLLLLLFIPLVV